MTEDRCCKTCAGSAPFKMCRTKHSCTCHEEQDVIAQKKHNALTYRDSTARQAVNNVMRERGK